MVIYNSKPNLNSINYTNHKLIRLPEGLESILSDEDIAHYKRLSYEEKDDFLRELLPDYLRAKGVDLTRPMTCPCPKHLDKHPSTSMDTRNEKYVKCWSCDETFSIFDVVYFDYFYVEGQTVSFMADDELPAVKKKVEELFGLRSIPHDTPNMNAPIEPATTNIVEPTIDPETQKVIDKVESVEPVSISSLHRESVLPYYGSRSTCVDKWATRGINAEMVDKFNLGYSPAKDGLIIPNSTAYNIRFFNPVDGQKCFRPGGSSNYPFNCECLTEADDSPVFITEGEIDALSFIQGGYRAIALGGLTYTNLVAIIKGLTREQKASLRLVVATDNDEKGADAKEDILTALKTLGIRATSIANLYGNCKDANEFLMKDESGFKAIVGLAVKQAMEELAEPAPFLAEEKTPEELANEYIGQTSMLSFMDKLNTSLTDPAAHPTISTGIRAIDEAIGGGLRSELYVIGACSSLGKTTLCHQIADYLAQSGKHVLFYSLEMSKESLVYKSLTRLSALSGNPVLVDKTLSMGDLYNWSQTPHLPEEHARLNSTIDAYKTKIAPSMYIFESSGTLTVEDIRNQMQHHVDVTGITPILFVDYLQIISGGEDRWDAKRIVDFNISELKRISRDFSTPVILISSLNRASYIEKISMSAFKESGSIEYGCDVLIGLQLSGVSEVNNGTAGAKKIIKALDEAVTINKKAGNDLLIDFRLLKNRSGATTSTRLSFNSRAGYFKSDCDVKAWVKTVWQQTPSSIYRKWGAGADWLELMLGNYDYKFGLELDELIRFEESRESGSIAPEDEPHPPLPESKFGHKPDQEFTVPLD